MTTYGPPAGLPRLDEASLAIPTVERSSRAVVAERRAWVVLWLAFATFCLLVASGVKYATEFVTSAEIDRTARVDEARGLVFVQDARLGSSDRELHVGNTIEASRTGLVSLSLFDGSRVTLQNGGRVQLLRMDVGRFINQQTLLLSQSAGPVRYQPAGGMTVLVPNGEVKLSRGDATVWVQGDHAQVLVYTGDVQVDTDGGSAIVHAGERTEVLADRRAPVVQPRATSLLTNGDFARKTENWDPIDVREGPLDVDGERSFVDGPAQAAPGVPALRIVRVSQTDAHGETGLLQKLNLDVSGYRSLFVEALVRVDQASLSGGGQLGSEYPLMLRVQYEGAAEGSRPDWTNGFYYQNPEDRPVRNATQIPQGVWVPYRVNLMDQDESRRPFRLLSFEVMGQGHTYDSRVADIKLIGD